jgi:hypothetical protein
MAFYDINSNNLKDSKEFSKAIAKNIVPKNGVAITKTSFAQDGYRNQTLSSADIISAASGKELLANGVYTNIYRINMMNENLRGLAVSIMEDKITLSKDNPTGQLDTSQDIALRKTMLRNTWS